CQLVRAVGRLEDSEIERIADTDHRHAVSSIRDQRLRKAVGDDARRRCELALRRRDARVAVVLRTWVAVVTRRCASGARRTARAAAPPPAAPGRAPVAAALPPPPGAPPRLRPALPPGPRLPLGPTAPSVVGLGPACSSSSKSKRNEQDATRVPATAETPSRHW